MIPSCDPRPYLRHQSLAMAWVRYNSRSGKVSEAQTVKVMRQLSVSDLERMLAERNALPADLNGVAQ
jgi:hypothetical protein